MVNGLLFHMTQPTSRSIIKAIACSKPTISEHYSKWKHNGTIVDQRKQRGALCHIGLAKDRGGHLVNQPRLSFFDVLRNNSWTSNGHNEKKNKKTSERRTWWRICTGETACLCTQMSGSNLSEGRIRYFDAASTEPHDAILLTKFRRHQQFFNSSYFYNDAINARWREVSKLNRPKFSLACHWIRQGWPNCGSSNIYMQLFELSEKYIFFISVAKCINIVKCCSGS